MISERKAVELLFPVHAMRQVVFEGVSDHDQPDFRDCMSSFMAADSEVMEGRNKDDWFKLRRRVRRLHDVVLPESTTPGKPVGEVGLVVFAIVEAMLDSDYLTYHAGSAVERGTKLFLEAITHHATEPALASARERAAAVISSLQHLGYYGAPAAA